MSVPSNQSYPIYRTAFSKGYEVVPAVTVLVSRLPELIEDIEIELTEEHLSAIETIVRQYEKRQDKYDSDRDEVPCVIKHHFDEGNRELACEYAPCPIATLLISAYNTASKHQDFVMTEAMRVLMSMRPAHLVREQNDNDDEQQ